MTRRRWFTLVAALLALSGCAVLEDAGLVRPSPATLEWTSEDAALVSRHLVEALMLSYSSDTVFSLTGDSPLGTAVEARLRESGYAIAAPSEEATAGPDSLALHHTAGFVSGEQGVGPVWAGLSVEGWRVDGLFARGHDGQLELSGGLTVRGR